MLLKKVVVSFACTVTMILLCSTYSYAATDDSNMRADLEQSLPRVERIVSNERSHYNLDENDIVSNNLKLGEIYQNNTIDIDADTNTNKLSKKIKKRDEYLSTIMLKDSNKPIALAFIEKIDSKWVIYSINSNNSLNDEIENYKKTVNDNPIVIYDQANGIKAIGSEEKGDTVKIISKNPKLKLEKGNFEKISSLKPKIKKLKTMDIQNTTGAAVSISNDSTGGIGVGGSTDTTSNYIYWVISIISLASIVTFFYNIKKT